ncbi:MAG TPA: membrane dipeptidase [Terriglobales bacterium]|nr:membrane dipeptidase [Terriglobales bacterium]
MFSDQFLDRLLSVGVSCVVVTAAWENGHNFRTAIDRITDSYSILGGGRIRYGETVEDILEAHKNRKVAVVLQFQNTSPIEHDVRLLEVWYKLGVRVMELTYSQRNLVGDGCDEETDVGLSNFGRRVVQEMNRIGLVVDLSHTSYMTSMDAIELSKDPIIFSHSNVKALADFSNDPEWPKRRNLADDQIKALAEKDGVMGIAAQSFLIKNDWQKKPPVVKDMVDHIEYVVKLVGANHVGIGLDYTEGNGPPENAIHSVTDLIEITADLMRRGYSKNEIRKILGENFLRVFRRVWKTY